MKSFPALPARGTQPGLQKRQRPCRQRREGFCKDPIGCHGTSKSTKRTAYQEQSCISSPLEIRVSVSSLLRLAIWCSQLARDQENLISATQQGGSPCPNLLPPAPSGPACERIDAGAAGSALDAPSLTSAEGSRSAIDADGGSMPGSCQRTGGQP